MMHRVINALWLLAAIAACWEGSTRVQLLLLTLFVLEIAVDLKRIRSASADSPIAPLPIAENPQLSNTTHVSHLQPADDSAVLLVDSLSTRGKVWLAPASTRVH